MDVKAGSTTDARSHMGTLGQPHDMSLAQSFSESQTNRWAEHDVLAGCLLSSMYVIVLFVANSRGQSSSQPATVEAKSGWAASAHQLACLCLLTVPALLSLAAPAWYRTGRRRAGTIALARLGTIFLLPTAQQLADGGIFATVATPGQLLLKFVAGTRVASLVFISLAYPLPLGWLLPIQAAAAAKAVAESHQQLCALPQLASPLAMQLAMRLATCLRWAVLFHPSGSPSWWLFNPAKEGMPAQEAAVPGSVLCRSAALWLQLVWGWALPLLLRWLLTARARKAFYRSKCRRRDCDVCFDVKHADLLGTGVMLVVFFLVFALVAWDAVLITSFQGVGVELR